MNGAKNEKNRVIGAIHKLENWSLVAVTAAIVVFSATQILLRNVFDAGIIWISPLLGVLVLWVGLLGALLATRNRAHIKINILETYLPQKYKLIVQAVSNLFSAVILFVLTFYSIEFVKLDLDTTLVVFGSVPVWVAQIILPATFMLMALRFLIYSVTNIIEFVKKLA